METELTGSEHLRDRGVACQVLTQRVEITNTVDAFFSKWSRRARERESGDDYL